MKKLKNLLYILFLPILLISCGGDDDIDDNGTSDNCSVSMSCKKSNVENKKWYYTATITIRGPKAEEVDGIYVRWQKSGESHANIKDAGGATLKTTCTFGGLSSGSTYYVWVEVNANRKQYSSSKQTIRIR